MVLIYIWIVAGILFRVWTWLGKGDDTKIPDDYGLSGWVSMIARDETNALLMVDGWLQNEYELSKVDFLSIKCDWLIVLLCLRMYFYLEVQKTSSSFTVEYDHFPPWI